MSEVHFPLLTDGTRSVRAGSTNLGVSCPACWSADSCGTVWANQSQEVTDRRQFLFMCLCVEGEGCVREHVLVCLCVRGRKLTSGVFLYMPHLISCIYLFWCVWCLCTYVCRCVCPHTHEDTGRVCVLLHHSSPDSLEAGSPPEAGVRPARWPATPSISPAPGICPH